MPNRVTSPRFIGRGPELARLETAFKLAVAEERAATFLIGGEAGVGKTRLLAELSAKVVSEGGLVLSGSCLELVDRALPFGPIVQALRALHDAVDAVTLDAIIGTAHEAVARLVPEVGARGIDDAAGESAALFEQLLGVLGRLGDRVPTVLVLEDLHWADHSTRDLLVFLARNLRDARIVLVGTFRSDDLHRRHPLRAVLAELDRAGAAERIDLERFDRDELRELVTSIVDEEPAADLVTRTYDRSDGNAFFAEELLAARECVDAMPDSLRDIVMARVDAMPEDAQHVLGVLAVIGRRADHRLVAALSDLDDARLLGALRDAVAHQVLVTEPDDLTYRFRHALVHEAVYDDLLPGERVQLHSRLAAVLTEQPEWFEGGDAGLASELACHWYAAYDLRRALPAALDAARAAERMYAYPESLAHVERALAIWPQVADAEEMTGMRHVDLLRHAAMQADFEGSVDRALDFIRAAADEVDPDVDPITAGLIHERWARYLWMLNAASATILQHCHEAVRLVPPTSSPARARVVATLAQQLMLAGHNSEAVERCQEAIAIAEEVRERVVEGHARNTLGSALAAIGQNDAGLDQLHLAREIAEEVGSWADVARAAVNEGGALQVLGRHHEALTLSLHGVEIARAHGLDRGFGVFLRLNAADSLFLLGRWDDVEEQLREVDAIGPVGGDAWRTAENTAMLLTARGDYGGADECIAEIRDLLGPERDTKLHMAVALLDIRVAIGRTDFAAAVELANESLGYHDDAWALCSDYGIAILTNGVAAAANLAERAREHREPEVEAHGRDAAVSFAQYLDSWVADERWGGGRPGDLAMVRSQISAEVARAEGRSSGQQWDAVAGEWERFEMPPRVAYARWRAAEAYATIGDRAAATVAARAAYDIASPIRYVQVRAGVEDLARRARLDLGEAVTLPPSAAEKLGLTAREVEVLRLVAEGRTNRQIAESLFIAAKTASVHVSNILAKLGAANRGEAAAAARRLGLDRVAS